jgi:hypothetical protein
MMALKQLVSMVMMVSRLLVSAMASKVSARKAYGTGLPACQVIRLCRSKVAWLAAASSAPAPTPSICGLQRAWGELVTKEASGAKGQALCAYAPPAGLLSAQ